MSDLVNDSIEESIKEYKTSIERAVKKFTKDELFEFNKIKEKYENIKQIIISEHNSIEFLKERQKNETKELTKPLLFVLVLTVIFNLMSDELMTKYYSVLIFLMFYGKYYLDKKLSDPRLMILLRENNIENYQNIMGEYGYIKLYAYVKQHFEFVRHCDRTRNNGNQNVEDSYTKGLHLNLTLTEYENINAIVVYVNRLKGD